MPLFKCDVCGCVENTALACQGCDGYAVTFFDWTGLEDRKGKKLCSECAPTRYGDGEPTEYGKWHGQFPKRPAAGMLIDQDGYLWSQDQVDAGMLPKHYKIVGRVD